MSELAVKRIYIYGGCALNPNEPEIGNMQKLGVELQAMYPDAQVLVVKYKPFELHIWPDTQHVFALRPNFFRTDPIGNYYVFIGLDGKQVEKHEMVIDESTLIVAHSYGCGVAANDVIESGKRPLDFIAMGPFMVDFYMRSPEFKEESKESKEAFCYDETRYFYRLRELGYAKVIIGSNERAYVKDFVDSWVRDSPVFHVVIGVGHGLSLWDLKSDVGKALLVNIRELVRATIDNQPYPVRKVLRSEVAEPPMGTQQ